MEFSQAARVPVVDVSQAVMSDVVDTHGDDDTFDDKPTAHDQEMESAIESDSTQNQRTDHDQAT